MTSIHRRGFLTGAATIAVSSTCLAEAPGDNSRLTTESLPESLREFGYEPTDDGKGYISIATKLRDGELDLKVKLIAKDDFLLTCTYIGNVANTATERLYKLLTVSNRIRPVFVELCDCKQCAEGTETSVYSVALLPNEAIGRVEFRYMVRDIASSYDRVREILAE